MGENTKRKWLQDQLMHTFGPRIKIVKNHQSALSGAGLPDTFMQAPKLGGVHLEFKFCRGVAFDWAHEPTKLQKQTLRELWLAGGNVGVIVYFEREDTWCSVHNEELIAAINGENTWLTGLTDAEGIRHWGCVRVEDSLDDVVKWRRVRLAQLVWGMELPD